MHQPILLSTWSFGKQANAAGWPILASGGSASDAVEAACRDAEADPKNRTVGVGGLPDASGRVSLDACFMLSPARCGAVAMIREFPHPISIARRVMQDTRHVLLAGADADAFAKQHGFEPGQLLTDDAKRLWEKWRATDQGAPARPRRNAEELGLNESHDTIGVLSLDSSGTLAGGCTTSGLAYKLPGRVGDSPIVGHGLYVDPKVGAAVATGHGELVMGVCGAFLAVESLRRGATPADAAHEVIRRIVDSYDLGEEDQIGVIVLDPRGNWSGASLRPGFRVAVRTKDRDELINAQLVMYPDDAPQE
ncbi:MAG: N(4)-(beta-N-acetylglucosaminyl)-L-asparaginase [Tepidisphaeraceae bacterium]